jgi:hypothetical protein
MPVGNAIAVAGTISKDKDGVTTFKVVPLAMVQFGRDDASASFATAAGLLTCTYTCKGKKLTAP